MPRLLGFDTNDRFNLTMALIAWLTRQEGRSVTIEEAAAHFGATTKDIIRSVSDINHIAPEVDGMETGVAFVDLDALEEGYLELLSADYFTDIPRLSSRQGSALLTGLSYLSTISEFEGDQDLAELMKLLGGNLEDGQNTVELVQQAIDPDAEVLRAAIIQGKRVSCEYINQIGELRRREIDPLRIDPRPDNWYVRAWCPESEMVKTFRLDRMKNAALTDTPIAPEAAAALTSEDLLYISRETDTEVTVEVDPEAYRLIAESDDVEALVASANKQGTVRAVIRVGYLPNIGHLIARYGGAARVIAPEEAKQYVLEFARKAQGSTVALSDAEVE